MLDDGRVGGGNLRKKCKIQSVTADGLEGRGRGCSLGMQADTCINTHTHASNVKADNDTGRLRDKDRSAS